jgi:hypothetical protein
MTPRRLTVTDRIILDAVRRSKDGAAPTYCEIARTLCIDRRHICRRMRVLLDEGKLQPDGDGVRLG